MNPVSISAVENRNGVLTFYVLMDDGTILKKAEDDTRWQEIDTVSRHRDEPVAKPNLVSSNKGRKKRGD